MDTWSEKVHTTQNYELCPVLESGEKWSTSTLWIMHESVLPGILREVEREEGEESHLSFYLTNADNSHHMKIQHGLAARILEWVAIPFSRGSSWPRDWTLVSCIAGRFFTIWATREALPDFKIYYKSRIIKMVWYGNKR